MKEAWETPLHEFMDRPEAIRVPRGTLISLRFEQVTPAELNRRSIGDLVSLAKVLGIPHSGTHEVVAARILSAIELRGMLANATVDELRTRPGKELRALLKQARVYIPSNKYGMAAALVGWRDRCRLEGRKALAETNHYLIVRRAVRAGLDVPDEILERYPDLQEKNNPLPLFAAAAGSTGD